MLRKNKPKFLVHFNDGAFIEQINGGKKYTVRFIRNNAVEFSAEITQGNWLKTNIRYLTPWRIEIIDENYQLVAEHRYDLTNKIIRINIDSKCIGDTLAWLPQIEQFSLRYPDSKVYVSQFLSGLGFRKKYPDLHFIDGQEELPNTYATYHIGYYFDEVNYHHPNDPRTVTLGQVASDILGIQYQEIRPKLTVQETHRKIHSPYVCIATQSTSGCKLWQHEGGWQQVVDYLHSKGLQTVVIQKEPCELENVIDKTGDLPLQDRMTDILHCEYFIGLGSGLSWLAWSLQKRVILISGFSLPFAEFDLGCTRIINSQACHGCWNSTEYKFDRNDWNWCPVHKGSIQQFECSTLIIPQQIFEAIDDMMIEIE